MATTATPPSSGHRYLLWLRALRRERGWTQLQLSYRAGVSERAISAIERGHSAQLCTVHRLAAALGVPSQVLHAPAGILG